ncbi:hypothetical protein, partial [Pseudomonas syringae]|uniref:hypothetical protein n=1 Tax=Pseudomonas syringae TaxID=317 RepID=UPI001FFB0E8A
MKVDPFATHSSWVIAGSGIFLHCGAAIWTFAGLSFWLNARVHSRNAVPTLTPKRKLAVLMV